MLAATASGGLLKLLGKKDADSCSWLECRCAQLTASDGPVAFTADAGLNRDGRYGWVLYCSRTGPGGQGVSICGSRVAPRVSFTM